MSGKFKFSLDKLLELRRDKEEESKRLFTESQREKRKLEEKIENLQNNYDKYKGINEHEDVVYQKLKRYYIQGLQNGIKAAQDDLVTKNLEVDKRRRELVEKQIERKTVETLKEKKYNAFVKEQERVEQINLDELALYAFIRNRNN
ncbi:flagellar export protein FliJ [uncultured Clostridium sp.]|uniref:flagellar export protein FliJ n=1 Tax=uncultured Clostridium sp. TaxID=59620 RepID=UPI0025E22FE0|nr:flagellar export protein FliJ [uncultured Clostridium sp.]